LFFAIFSQKSIESLIGFIGCDGDVHGVCVVKYI